MAQPPKKRQDIDKLRRILDNPDDPTLTRELTTDDTSLDSVRRRLSTKPQVATARVRTTPSLQPRVTIRQPQPTTPTTTEELPTWTPTTAPTTPSTTEDLPLWTPIDTPTTTPPASTSQTISFDFSDQPLFEIERLDEQLPFEPVNEPITPEPTQASSQPSLTQTEPLPDWELVTPTSTEPETVPLQEFTEVTTEPAAVSPEPAPPAELKLSWRERRAAKKTARIQEREAIRREQLTRAKIPEPTPEPELETIPEPAPTPEPPVEPEESTEQPLPPASTDAFREIPSIDDRTAALLINSGYNTVEQLHQTPVATLVKIKGIKRKHAKQIKKDVDAFYSIPPAQSFEEPLPERVKPRSKKRAQKTSDSDLDEWESYQASDELHTPPICTQDGYTLYQREIKQGRKKSVIHFFSKSPPADGQPASLPEGFEVSVNRRTGVPYIKKKK